MYFRPIAVQKWSISKSHWFQYRDKPLFRREIQCSAGSWDKLVAQWQCIQSLAGNNEEQEQKLLKNTPLGRVTIFSLVHIVSPWHWVSIFIVARSFSSFWGPGCREESVFRGLHVYAACTYFGSFYSATDISASGDTSWEHIVFVIKVLWWGWYETKFLSSINSEVLSFSSSFRVWSEASWLLSNLKCEIRKT